MSFLHYRWFPTAALALFGCLSLTLAATKAPWCDEGWFANAAYNLANHGHMGSSLQEPSGHYLNAYLRGIQERTYVVPPLYLVTLAAWLKLWGNGLVVMRAYAILWGLITLISFNALANRLTGDRTLAVLATAMTAIDFTFLFAATDVRMESMMMGLSLTSWLAYLHWRERNLRRAVLVSHSLLALACFSHPNAALFGCGLVYLFWLRDFKALRLGLICWAMLPYLLLGLGWALYIWESPSDFLAQFFANTGDSHRFEYLFQPWMNFIFEIGTRYFGHFGLLSFWAYPMPMFMSLIPVFYVASFWQFLRREDLRSRLGALWPLSLMIIGLLTFLVSYKAQNYICYTIPFWNLLIATWLLYGLDQGRGKCYLALFACLQLTCFGVRIAQNSRGGEYHMTALVMQDHMRQGHSLIAPTSMAFAVGFSGFIDDARLGRWSGRRPDALVVDRWYQRFHQSYGEKEPNVSRYVKKLLTEEYTPSAKFGDYQIYESKRLLAQKKKR